MIESIKSLIAENKEFKITLKAFILEIVLRGLSTLKTLNELILLEPPELLNLGNHPVKIIVISKIFHVSLI